MGFPITATNPDLTQSGNYPNFFRTIASDDAQAKREVDFAIDVLKVDKIAVIHDKGDYGKGLFARADFARMAEILGALQGRFILSINAVPETDVMVRVSWESLYADD